MDFNPNHSKSVLNQNQNINSIEQTDKNVGLLDETLENKGEDREDDKRLNKKGKEVK